MRAMLVASALALTLAGYSSLIAGADHRRHLGDDRGAGDRADRQLRLRGHRL